MPRIPRSVLAAMFAMPLASAAEVAAQQQTLNLTGTLRDFQVAHSDMQRQASGYPLIQGMVKTQLSEDDKPVLNPGAVQGAVKIKVTSTDKELSNVVLELDDGTEYKFDDQSGHESVYEVPNNHDGKYIVGAWVKAGNNASGDGPGYGEAFDLEYFQPGEHVVTNDSGTLTVTFYNDGHIPDVWRIESEETFDQWYRNVEGVNLSRQHTITLTQRQDAPHIYRFEASKHNGRSFFPLDGEMFGNEGNPHNYHFTYEIHTKFTYTDPNQRDYDLTFSFSGDDDVWVFVNEQLVVDIGGVHSERYDSVNIDDIAQQIGLEPGGSYDFHFFFAERHTTESNFTMETTIQFLSPLYD